MQGHSEEKHDEYELVPMSPLRRMEKRIELLEQSGTMDGKEFYREMVDIIRMNQQIVDELAKANDALRIEISKLPSRMEELISNMKELISFIKASATEEDFTAASTNPMNKKLEELVETNKKIVENNQAVLNVLEDLGRKLTKPAVPPMIMKKPFPPFTPQQMQRTV
jgi:pyruvate formate-lyase activating enzyme-like uncharacterized protein